LGPWSDPEVLRRLQGHLPAAARALKALHHGAGDGGGGGGGAAAAEGADEDGYHSPRRVRREEGGGFGTLFAPRHARIAWRGRGRGRVPTLLQGCR
jgi:hypothetical protein